MTASSNSRIFFAALPCHARRLRSLRHRLLSADASGANNGFPHIPGHGSARAVEHHVGPCCWSAARRADFRPPRPQKPLFWCLVLFAVTTAVAAAATEIHVFLVMRFFEGLGAAGAIVLSRSIAADRYTGRELGSFMGVMGAIQGIAPVTAPMLGALIADAAGWRGIFWILFGMGVVLAFITLFVFVETLPRSRINSAQRSSNGTQRESIRESSAKLIADPVFCGIVFQQLLASGILFGHISSSPFIFRGHFDLSPELYGLTFGLLALGITAGAVISSRIDPLKALGVGAVGMLVCAVLVAVCFITNLSLWAVLPFYFLLMAFLGLTRPAAMTAALTLHRQRAGFAAAVIGSVGFVGGGLVAPLTAIGEVTRTASIIFIVCGVLLVLISFWLNRRMKLIRGDELKL